MTATGEITLYTEPTLDLTITETPIPLGLPLMNAEGVPLSSFIDDYAAGDLSFFDVSQGNFSSGPLALLGDSPFTADFSSISTSPALEDIVLAPFLLPTLFSSAVAKGLRLVSGSSEAVTPDPVHVTLGTPKRTFGLAKEGNENDPTRFTYIVTIPKQAVENALNLPDQIDLQDLDGMPFSCKSEFHVTALGFATKDVIQEAIELDPSLRQSIEDLLSKTDFSFTLKPSTVRRINNESYDPEAVANGTSFESESTIAVDVEMPGMKEFYDGMARLIPGIELGKPCSHITLYIKEQVDARYKGRGIALRDLKGQKEGRVYPRISEEPLPATIQGQLKKP